MKRTYYLAIATAVLVAIVIFSLLNYTALLFLYVKYFESHNINVFFITPQEKLIQNVSVSLFAFYPTPNGTVIKKIYQGFNLKYLSVPVSNLTLYAKQWLKTYNYTVLIPNGTSVVKKYILYNASLIIPSLIGFASYYVINQSNGAITIYTQVFTVRVSLYNITHRIGKTVIREFINPIVKRIKIKENSFSSSSNIVTPQQTTITTVVPTQTTSFSATFRPYYEITYDLTTYWIYPSNSSQFGPIPQVLAYITDPNTNDYKGTIGFGEDIASSSGISISFGISLLSGALHFSIIGTSITLSSGAYKNSTYVDFGGPYPNFAEIYTLGQIAIANYTEYVTPCSDVGCSYPINEGNVTMFFFTALQIVKNGSVSVPALHTTNELPPDIPSYFTGKLTYEATSTAENWASYNDVFYTETSQGYFAGAIPLEPLIKYAPVWLGVTIPNWVTLVVSPYVAVSLFTSAKGAFAADITVIPSSSNVYYIYTEEASVPYDIGGNNYNLPIFYFYVNFTS